MIKILSLSLLTFLLFTGCAQNNLPTTDSSKFYNIDESTKLVEAKFFEPDIVSYNNTLNTSNLNKKQNSYIKLNTNLRKAIKMAANETIKNNKTHFIITQKNMNQLYDVPFVHFKEINEYCFKSFFYDFVYYGACSDIMRDNISSVFKFEMLNNPDYKTPAINAKDIINEINNYSISIEEINKIKDVTK